MISIRVDCGNGVFIGLILFNTLKLKSILNAARRNGLIGGIPEFAYVSGFIR